MNAAYGHKVSIRPKPGAEGRPLYSGNAEILLDGKPLRCVNRIAIEILHERFATVQVDFCAEVDVAAEMIRLDATFPQALPEDGVA